MSGIIEIGPPLFLCRRTLPIMYDIVMYMLAVNDFISHFETKVRQFTDEKRLLVESECLKLGKKDAESYPFLSFYFRSAAHYPGRASFR